MKAIVISKIGKLFYPVEADIDTITKVVHEIMWVYSDYRTSVYSQAVSSALSLSREQEITFMEI